MNELEEIKNRIDIVELIGGYVQLKKAGRNFKGLCPFHTEKTPSFIVSPEKQIWHCFGACSEGGDIFTFLQKIDGITFGEAVEKLAEKAGVKLSRRNYEKNKGKERLFSINEMAAAFYHDNLFSKEGERARKYLLQRGLNADTIKTFQLGLATDKKDGLIRELKKHNIKLSEIQKAGLASIKNGNLRDFFWKRIIFPIKDTAGRVVGFSARALDDNSKPKYINTPETNIYSKSYILYGLDLAKDAIRKLDYAIISEGMMDVIASWQSGVKNIVAPGGTALTQGQLLSLGRFTKNIKLAFDVDFAGNEATKKAIEIALKLGFNIKVIEIPQGKDPGEIAIKAPQKWKSSIKEAPYVIDYLFNESLKKHNKRDAIGRKHIAKELLPVIKRIEDEIEQETYIKRLANELLVSEKSIIAALKKTSLPKEKREALRKIPKKDSQEELEKNTLGLLALSPGYIDFAQTILKKSDFQNKKCGNFYQKMLDYYGKNKRFLESEFLGFLKEEGEDFKHYILSAETNFSDLSEEKKGEEAYLSIKRIKKISLNKQKRELAAQISKFEKKDKEKSKKLLKKLQKILEEERKIT